MASSRLYALRLDMERTLAGFGDIAWREVDPFGEAPPASVSADPRAWGDVVLARKEVPASYHLAVVVDDAFQDVSDVVRGRDLQPSTGVHRVLQALLGLPEPRYFHHRLILDESGEKLAKSRGSESIRARRAAGETPEEVIAGVGL
jgi:glutamyl-Q tRNA(Asp) synthetase